MKKKILLFGDDHSFPGRYVYSDLQKMWETNRPTGVAISASYATTSSYNQSTPPNTVITGSYLNIQPWTDTAGKPLSASWVSGPSTPFTPVVQPSTTKQIKADLNFIYNTDMNKLKENLDFLYTTKMDLEEQVAELQDEVHAHKRNSAWFLASKDTAQMETVVLKDQVTTLSQSLVKEKTISANDINYWKSKYDGMEGNHKYAVNHCTELNKTITLYKDEVKKLKDAKVNDEQLARQLLLKKQELESVLKKIATLEKENEDYRSQTFRLVNENSKYACPGTYLPELLQCGKCVSCQLVEATARVANLECMVQSNHEQTTKDAKLIETGNRVRQELADHLAAIKKEADNFKERCAQKDITISQLEATNKSMYNAAIDASNTHFETVTHLRNIITLLTRGINDITTAGLFSRKDIAEQTKIAVSTYRKRPNIENLQIYSGETIKE